MIDEIFAEKAINDFIERKKTNGDKTLMTLPETEAVVSLISKGKKEFLPLLINNCDNNNEDANRIKALLLGRIAVNDVKIDGFDAEDATYQLSLMKSAFAKGVIAELHKFK